MFTGGWNIRLPLDNTDCKCHAGQFAWNSRDFRLKFFVRRRFSCNLRFGIHCHCKIQRGLRRKLFQAVSASDDMDSLLLSGMDVNWGRMIADIFSDFRDLVSQLWQYQPILVVLICGGFLIFVLVVIDAHRHRKKRKSRCKKRLH